MFVVMNKAKSNSLGPEIQSVFKSTSRKWIDVHGERWDQGDRESLAYATSLKNEILELSSDEPLRWKEKVRPIIDAYISGASTRQLDGSGYVDMLVRAIDGQE